MPPRLLFDHPPGLSTLFLTEMWERFTHYGMRAILVLFMVSKESDGGLGVTDHSATFIYAMFVASCYLLSLVGGWIGDRFIGAQQAIVSGGTCILLGNVVLALRTKEDDLILGLLVMAIGVGLLKPNISVLVGRLYPEGGSRRDAGFSLFYMGINAGALLGALAVPLCSLRFGWHAGFVLSSIGMSLGMAQFLLRRRHLTVAAATSPRVTSKKPWLPAAVIVVLCAIIAVLVTTGRVSISAREAAAVSSYVVGLLAAAYFVYMLWFLELSTSERGRVYVMMALFVAATVAYIAEEQAGTSLTFFAERYTDRSLFGRSIPAGMFQGLNSLYIVLLAPAFSAIWVALGRRGKDLSIPVKFGIGLLLIGLSFIVMYTASSRVLTGHKVLPIWLVLSYGIQMCGDLCLGPVGLSAMTKLAAPRVAGQVMGVWFLSLALSNTLAGELATVYDATDAASMRNLLFIVFALSTIGGILMLVLARPLNQQLKGIR